MSNKTVAVLLRCAAAYLEEYGWRQKSGGVHLGNRCSIGAIGSAGHLLNAPLEDHDHAVDAVVAEVGMRMDKWNDQPYMTKEEVIDTLKRVADKVEAQE